MIHTKIFSLFYQIGTGILHERFQITSSQFEDNNRKCIIFSTTEIISLGQKNNHLYYKRFKINYNKWFIWQFIRYKILENSGNYWFFFIWNRKHCVYKDAHIFISYILVHIYFSSLKILLTTEVHYVQVFYLVTGLLTLKNFIIYFLLHVRSPSVTEYIVSIFFLATNLQHLQLL